MKDTLFLSKVVSERTEDKRGDVAALGAGLFPQPTVPAPRRDRVGELGQRKIPGLCLTGWVPSVQQRYRRGTHKEKQTLRRKLRKMRSTITKEREKRK